MKKVASATKLTSIRQAEKWIDNLPYMTTMRDETTILSALKEQGEVYVVWTEEFGFRIW